MLLFCFPLALHATRALGGANATSTNQVSGRTAKLPGAATEGSKEPEQLLLKDYRPRSIYNVPSTDIKRARFPVIDMHAHDHAKTDAELAEWVRTMDELNIKKTIVLSQAHGKEFDEIMARYKEFPGRFSVWCAFDYTGYDQPGYGPAAVAELERCFQAFFVDPPGWGMHFEMRGWIRCLKNAGSWDCPSAFTWRIPSGCTNRWTNTTMA